MNEQKKNLDPWCLWCGVKIDNIMECVILSLWPPIDLSQRYLFTSILRNSLLLHIRSLLWIPSYQPYIDLNFCNVSEKKWRFSHAWSDYSIKLSHISKNNNLITFWDSEMIGRRKKWEIWSRKKCSKLVKERKITLWIIEIY